MSVQCPNYPVRECNKRVPINSRNRNSIDSKRAESSDSPQVAVVMHSFEIVLKQRPKKRPRLPPYPLFAKFKLFFGLGVAFAGVGLAVEVTDYTQRYAPDRTHANLAELDCADTLRCLAVACALAAGLCLCIKEKALVSWGESQGEWRHSSWRLGGELLLLGLFPYPGLTGHVTFQGRRDVSTEDWVWTEYKYTLAEVFLVVSCLRVYLLYAFMLQTNSYCDSLSMSIRSKHKVPRGSLFTLKAYFALQPWRTIILMMAPVLSVCSLTITVFERPVRDITPKWDFYPYANACWLVAESVLSLNFGDLVPISHISRLASLLCGLLGVVLISAIVHIAKSRALRLTPEQISALAVIENQKKAHTAIITAFRYYKAKKSGDFAKIAVFYIKVQRILKAFRQSRRKMSRSLRDDSEKYSEALNTLEEVRVRVKGMLEVTAGK